MLPAFGTDSKRARMKKPYWWRGRTYVPGGAAQVGSLVLGQDDRGVRAEAHQETLLHAIPGLGVGIAVQGGHGRELGVVALPVAVEAHPPATGPRRADPGVAPFFGGQ